MTEGTTLDRSMCCRPKLHAIRASAESGTAPKHRRGRGKRRSSPRNASGQIEVEGRLKDLTVDGRDTLARLREVFEHGEIAISSYLSDAPAEKREIIHLTHSNIWINERHAIAEPLPALALVQKHVNRKQWWVARDSNPELSA